MSDSLKSFRDAVRRSVEQPSKPVHPGVQQHPVVEKDRIVQEGGRRYRGFVLSVNRMRDREIENALSGH